MPDSRTIAEVTPDPVLAWRDRYAETSKAPTWLGAHHWRYGPEVAALVAADVRQKLMLSPGDDVLEVGAGSGGFLSAVLHDGQPGVGFDLCEAVVRGGERFGVDRHRIRLGVAEAGRLPIREAAFDKVLCYSVTQYFPDDDYVRLAVRELIRVTRPGGLVLLGDICGTMERLRRRLLRCGLRERLAEAILTSVTPLRRLRWSLDSESVDTHYRTYRRSYFCRLLEDLPCEHEFLRQDIPGRVVSASRFDIRIRKSGS